MNAKAISSNWRGAVCTALVAPWRSFGVKKASTACLMAGMALAASAQSFYNLDFESARVTPPGPAQVPIGLGLPGWTGYCGGEVQTTVNYNQEYLDTVGISILDTNDSQLQLAGLLHGRYCALIQSGHGWGPSQPVDAALAQRGAIPAYAKSIVFNAGWVLSGAELVVTFNGTPIPIAALSPQATYMAFGGDVTPFAGQTGELRFTRPVLWRSFPPNPILYPSYGPILLDDIRFPDSPLQAAPVILVAPRNQSAHLGSVVDFNVSATGFPAPVYQWFFNGTNAIAGATSSILELTNVQLSEFGAYVVVITNIYGSITSPPALLTRDPSILAQPANQFVDAGQTASLSVQAAGTWPLGYQWMKDSAFVSDGGNATGAQTTNLTLKNVLAEDAGGYSVIVGNTYGSITSQVAILRVRDPAITNQPGNHSAAAGGTVSFTVSAAGSPPLTYQWFFNGSPIAGGSSSNLQLTNIQLSDAGAYSVVVTNAFGAVTSAPALLGVSPRSTYTVLHRFTGADGWGPWGILVSSGQTLYGTTRYNYGTVFKVNKDGGGFSTLHRFMLSDGADPTGPLVLSGSTLYGTTQAGGSATDPGTVFKINVDGSAFAILRDFANGGGRWPNGLLLSGATLYGTTSAGGTAGCGTMFKINTDGTGFTVLHNFNGYPGDGYGPSGGLTLSGTTIYGAAGRGGSNGPPTGWPDAGYGTLFKVNTDGSGYTILRHFTSDSRGPLGGLALSGTTLYGVTAGGLSSSGDYNAGTLFKMNSDGSGYTVLHTFTGPPGDGALPYWGLLSCGTTLCGTTAAGGGADYSPPNNYGSGTIFKINTDGTGYSLLHEFSGGGGVLPYGGGLLLDGATLYGTTSSGGISNNGVVFALSLPMPNVLTPPASQTAETGSSVVFGVRAESDPTLTFQWFFNGTNIISDATTSFCLQLTGVDFSQSGTYSVLIRNAFGSVTSAPAMLSVIPPVPRRIVPALSLSGQPGGFLNLDNAALLAPSPNWAPFDTVALTNTSQWYFDLSDPLPLQRFYRAWQSGSAGSPPALDLHMVPALNLTGTVGSSWQIDYINRFGPLDAWSNLATVTLTNTSQLYFDTSSIGQAPRLWRVVPAP